MRESDFAAWNAAVALGFWIPETILIWFVPQGFVHESELAAGARGLLYCYVTAVLIIVLWCIPKLATLLVRRLRRRAFEAPWIGLLFKIAVASAAATLTFGYVLSWATFWQVGTFLNTEAVRFWLTQPLQVFHWIDWDVGTAVIIATLLAGFTVFYWLPSWVVRWPEARRSRLIGLVKTALAICLFWAGVGEIYGARGEQAYLHSTLLYTRARDSRSTPLASAIGEFRSALSAQPEQPPEGQAPQLTRRKIIPMEEYVREVDRAKLKPLNVVLIIVESLRADQLREYGSARAIMPTVDALARESKVFINARSQSSQTSYAVFAPLSSHYPLRSAAAYSYPETLTYPRVLIHNVLKPLGYRTAVFSSSNENWEGMIHYLRSGDIDHLFYASLFNGPTYTFPGDTSFANWVMTTAHAGSVDDRFTTDQAIRWIDAANDRPFFIYMNLQNSHLPYRVPDDFQRRFSPDKIDFSIRFGYFPRDKTDIVKDVYADSLAYVDSQIGRLFQHLRARGLWDQTLVVVTGDHGQAFYEHGFSAHASALYDEVMKVPLVMRAPGLPAGVDHRLAQHIDVPPTVLSLLGLPPHPSFQGTNLLSDQPDPDRLTFMVTQNALVHQYGVVHSHWKLIYDERRRAYLLFDLLSDPGETKNLALAEKTVVRRLAERLHAWRAAQIRYYSDAGWHRREYPPLLAD